MTLRDYMRGHDENMTWCKPYITEDESVAFTLCEGNISAFRMDGSEKRSNITAGDLNVLARRLEPDYDFYEGYTDKEIIFNASAARERPCCECPWFEDCAAMDDPVDFDE